MKAALHLDCYVALHPATEKGKIVGVTASLLDNNSAELRFEGPVAATEREALDNLYAKLKEAVSG